MLNEGVCMHLSRVVLAYFDEPLSYILEVPRPHVIREPTQAKC